MTDTVGLPTLTDIMAELAKPGRDPAQAVRSFSFAEGMNEIDDVQPGMKLPGVVTNVTAFGAFVDIGVHQDGLVHISQLADRFVKDPAEVVKVHQRVMVTVLDVDLERKRISLSMRENRGQPEKQEKNRRSLRSKKLRTENQSSPSRKDSTIPLPPCKRNSSRISETKFISKYMGGPFFGKNRSLPNPPPKNLLLN